MRKLVLFLSGLILPMLALAQNAPKLSDESLGMPPPPGAIVLFNGKDMTGWIYTNKKKAGEPVKWLVADGVMTISPPKEAHIRTEREFGDYLLHVEYCAPYMPQAKGQGRGNTGIYLGGRYELQLLDDYGLPPTKNGGASFYAQAAPDVNASKPPLQWQTLDIEFRNPVVVNGEVTKKAHALVKQNGVVIHDRDIVPTDYGIDKDATKTSGPIMIQQHSDPVQFRNIWLKPLDK